MNSPREWTIDTDASSQDRPGRLRVELLRIPDSPNAKLYIGPHADMPGRFQVSLVVGDGAVECDTFPFPAQVRAAVIALLQARNLPPLPSDILDQLPKDAA